MYHLEDTAHSEATGTLSVRHASNLLALVGGEAGPVVPGDPRALRVLKLHPGDQVQKLDADIIVDTLSMVNNS